MDFCTILKSEFINCKCGWNNIVFSFSLSWNFSNDEYIASLLCIHCTSTVPAQIDESSLPFIQHLSTRHYFVVIYEIPLPSLFFYFFYFMYSHKFEMLFLSLSFVLCIKKHVWRKHYPEWRQEMCHDICYYAATVSGLIIWEQHIHL